MGEGQLRAAGRWGPGSPSRALERNLPDASPAAGSLLVRQRPPCPTPGDGAPGSSVHVSAPQSVPSVSQSCSELSGPCSPPHGVRSPTPSADRTTAGPATARWRPGPGAPLPPAPRTTSSWLRSKERTSCLVRAVAQGGGTGGGGSRWGLGLPQGLGMEGWKQVLCPGEGGSGLALSPSASLFLFPRHLGPQGGRPGCSDQQAGGAYWTAGEQGGPAEPPHPSLHPPSTLPAPQGEIRPEFTRGKSGNLNAPGRGWRGGVD